MANQQEGEKPFRQIKGMRLLPFTTIIKVLKEEVVKEARATEEKVNLTGNVAKNSYSFFDSNRIFWTVWENE